MSRLSLTTGSADDKNTDLLFHLRAENSAVFHEMAKPIADATLDLWEQHPVDLPYVCHVMHMLNHLSSWRGKVVKALRRRQAPQIDTDWLWKNLEGIYI